MFHLGESKNKQGMLFNLAEHKKDFLLLHWHENNSKKKIYFLCHLCVRERE